MNTPVVLDSSQINVYGYDLVDEDEHLIMGRMTPFDNDGIACAVDADWDYCFIEINNTQGAEEYLYSIYYTWEEVFVAAKKIFLHEIGHALKLAHPVQSTSHTGENSYGRYPYAIMNKGSLNETRCASNTITDHDKSCLIAKWGK